MVNGIDPHPLADDRTEASSDALEKANHPVRDVEILSDTEGHVELAATVLPTTAEGKTLDALVATLEASVLVQSATWTVETTV